MWEWGVSKYGNVLDVDGTSKRNKFGVINMIREPSYHSYSSCIDLMAKQYVPGYIQGVTEQHSAPADTTAAVANTMWCL